LHYVDAVFPAAQLERDQLDLAGLFRLDLVGLARGRSRLAGRGGPGRFGPDW